MSDVRARKNLLLILVILLILLITSSPSLLADEISLKNGDRLTGTIIKSDAKTLVIKTETAGDVIVQWPAVDAISSTQPLHVGVAGGQVLVGAVSTTDGQIHIATQAAGAVTVPKASVQFIRSDAEQAAYDAATERLQHPHLTDFWSGTLDTGLSLTNGNSSILSFTLSGRATRETDRDKISAYATSIYGRNGNTSPAQTIANQTQGGIRVDVNLGPRAFAFGSADFNTNKLQNLDLQNVIAGGVGYHVVKTANTSFDVFGGAAFNQEFFAAYTLPNPIPPPATLSFAAVTQRNAELLAGEQFDTKLGGRTTLGESFTIFPNISGPSGYHFNFNSTASTTLRKWLGWQVTFTDLFLSNPPFGIKRNDLLLSTGLRLAFGKAAQ